MDWDYKFYEPTNNPFQKQWSTSSQEEEPMVRIVTEVNRGKPCVVCQKSIGEVATMFYEIDEKCYCSKCGIDLATHKERSCAENKK